jgi:hypothetical protein
VSADPGSRHRRETRNYGVSWVVARHAQAESSIRHGRVCALFQHASPGPHLPQNPVRRRLRLTCGGQKRRRIVSQRLEPSVDIGGMIFETIGSERDACSEEGRPTAASLSLPSRIAQRMMVQQNGSTDLTSKPGRPPPRIQRARQLGRVVAAHRATDSRSDPMANESQMPCNLRGLHRYDVRAASSEQHSAAQSRQPAIRQKCSFRGNSDIPESRHL